jgi:superfamily II DNA or RNA helicase
MLDDAAPGLHSASLRDAALRLLDARSVTELRVLREGRIVSGVVHGGPGTDAAGEKHRVYIQYRGAARERMQGECSCGAAQLCVHVAAVDLAIARGYPSDGAAVIAAAAPREPAAGDAYSGPQSLCYLLSACAPGAFALSLWVGAGRESSRPLIRFALRNRAATDELPRYVTSADRTLLLALGESHGEETWELAGAVGCDLLRRIVATGRGAWDGAPQRALSWGRARKLPCAWVILPDGSQHLAIQAAAHRHIELAPGLEPAAYLDPATGECGLLETAGLDLLRRHWGRAPLGVEEAAIACAAISQSTATEGFPSPHALVVERRPDANVEAGLRLAAGPSANLYYVYDGCEIASETLQHAQAFVRHFDGESVRELPRDREAEGRIAARLASLLPAPAASAHAWLEFMQFSVPLLRAAGWRVDVDASFPFRIAAATEWFTELRAVGNREWFDLRLGILVDGEAVNLLPALVEFLNGDSPDTAAADGPAHKLVRLDDGRYLPVPCERIRRIGETLVELFEHDALGASGTLRLPCPQVARLRDLEFEREAARLDAADSGVPDTVLPPANFRATLRPYQQEGLAWLQSLRHHGRGGILADDMGLGKTIQTLAHLALEKQHGRRRGPSLIVAPVSLLGNWHREIARFAPDLEVVVSHGAGRGESVPRWGRADIVITSYSLLHVDRTVLAAQEFYFVILDEAQIIKNPRAQVSRAARALPAVHRLCLTGTPVENHLGELWSLCDFLQPGLLGDARSFQRLYRTPIEKLALASRAAALRRRLQPYVLRRTKDAVARELPPKMQILEVIRFDEAQRDRYDGIRLAMHRRVRDTIARHGLARSRITFLDALLKLRQVCCDPRLVAALDRSGTDVRPSIGSAKLDWLMRAVPEMISVGRRILVFSQFTSMLNLIATALDERAIAYEMLTGATRDRGARTDAFQAGSVPVLLLSLKAGGTGLNLTAADTVIHYDPWWNPAAEMQATDRAHRIGQDKPVFVYKLVAEASVEEKILRLQAGKQALLAALYAESGANAPDFDAACVEELLAP